MPATAAVRLQALERSLTQQQASASRALLDDVRQRLPPAWSGALSATPITVEWRDDLPPHVHGRALDRRILLDRDLLLQWMDRHGDEVQSAAIPGPAQAAAIHELGHLYDRSAQGGISRDPRFLDLAGWQVSPARFGLRERRNRFTDRSPDRYELASPAEFLAVNLEHFLLDPDYACRRPALHRYLKQRLGGAPPSGVCAPGFVYLGTDVAPPEPLDPERVHSIDYLLADDGEQAMSLWGHGMLRLVICAPGRERGPDCRLDLQHHRVLSFRAFVDDLQISGWRGLTGSYPSRLFVLPLEQVVEEYTRVELRGLQSVPLRLERDEIAAVLERAATVHWSYDGRYRFIGNNCAVETFKLLHDALPRVRGAGLRSITPKGLLRRLMATGLVDPQVPGDPSEALRLGYRFDSASAHYRAMFEVARSGTSLPHRSFEAWLDLPATKRSPHLERGDLRATAALLLLEQAALRRQELRAREQFQRRVHRSKRGRPGAADRLERAVGDVARAEARLSRPAILLEGRPEKPGYGLPQRAEREALTRQLAEHARSLEQQRARLRVEGLRWLSAGTLLELDRCEDNLDRLGAHLRLLHQQSGGLDLDSPRSP